MRRGLEVIVMRSSEAERISLPFRGLRKPVLQTLDTSCNRHQTKRRDNCWTFHSGYKLCHVSAASLLEIREQLFACYRLQIVSRVCRTQSRSAVRHDYTLTNPTVIPVPDRSDGAKCIAVGWRKKAVLPGRGSVRAPDPFVWDDQCLCELD